MYQGICNLFKGTQKLFSQWHNDMSMRISIPKQMKKTHCICLLIRSSHMWAERWKPFKRRDCVAGGGGGEKNEGFWGNSEEARAEMEKEVGYELTRPAVCLRFFSSGTSASLDRLKETPAFPLSSSPQQTSPPSPWRPEVFSYRNPPSSSASNISASVFLIVSARYENKLSSGSFAPPPPPIIRLSPQALLLCSFTHLGQTHHPPTA